MQILTYHAWVLSGSPNSSTGVLSEFLQLSGEIGVTAFFALSGFGMFNSIMHSYDNRTFSYKSYLQKRAFRILPPYYFCLAVSILLLNGNFIGINGLKHVITHVFLIHNLFPSCHGSINGALWTMGTIAQFYLIAPFLCRLFQRNGHLTMVSSIALTVLIKFAVYHVFYQEVEDSGWYAFFGGRQLITALDNFTVGMFVAWFIKKHKVQLNAPVGLFLTVGSFIVQLYLCSFGSIYGVHTNNLSGYLWHSMIAITIGLAMIGISYLPTIKIRLLQYLAKNEYPIYLWHLTVYNNLLQRSEFIMSCSGKIRIILLISIAILAGALLSKSTINLDMIFLYHQHNA